MFMFIVQCLLPKVAKQINWRPGSITLNTFIILCMHITDLLHNWSTMFNVYCIQTKVRRARLTGDLGQ